MVNKTRVEEINKEIKKLEEERSRLKEMYEAIMAGAWKADEHNVEARVIRIDNRLEKLYEERNLG